MSTKVAYILLGNDMQNEEEKYINPARFNFAARFFAISTLVAFIVATILFLMHATMPIYMFNSFIISVYFWGFFLFAGICTFYFDAQPKRVRYRTMFNCTWFSQVFWVNASVAAGLAFFSAIMGLYFTYFIVVGVAWHLDDLWRAVPRIAWVASPAFWFSTVYSLRELYKMTRTRPGIRLSSDRVVVNHDYQDTVLRWQQIVGVSAATMEKFSGRKKPLVVPCVRVETDSGEILNTEAFDLGSDPNVVAAFMRYYRDNPREREALTDPEEAIRRFGNAQSAS